MDSSLIDKDTNLATPEPTCGRIVLYVLPDGPCHGEIRPAIVTTTGKAKGWQYPEHERVVQLRVFLDGTNDVDHSQADQHGNLDKGLIAMGWRTSVIQDQSGKQPGTWHWMDYQLTAASKDSKTAHAEKPHGHAETDKHEKTHGKEPKHK